MIITDKIVDKVTKDLYQLYGSSTGWLFGIPPGLRSAVRGIVKIVLEADLTIAEADADEED